MEFCTLKNGKPQRLAVETPAFTLQTQVLVAGLGTAGSLAAITAAVNVVTQGKGKVTKVEKL